MNKIELVAKVAAASELTKAETERILDRFIEAIGVSLMGGEEVNLPGFGKFVVVERAAKVGRNPKTGEKVDIPAKRAVKFKPAMALKDAVA